MEEQKQDTPSMAAQAAADALKAKVEGEDGTKRADLGSDLLAAFESKDPDRVMQTIDAVIRTRMNDIAKAKA